MIIASSSITLAQVNDGSDGNGVKSVNRYYILKSSAPSKPTSNPPDGWTTTEPTYTSGSTDSLYFCDLTTFSDGTWAYSTVSKSSSYEAAKEAWNKAQNAQDVAEEASKIATNYMNFDETDGLVVGNMTAETLGNNVRIDSDSVDIRSGSNVLATFASNLISLGKAAANAVIELCGGVGKISADKADDSDSIFNRLWITAKNMFLKGNQINLTTSTQYDNPSQSYSESAYSTIECDANAGVASGTASSSFEFTAVNNPNDQSARIIGYAGNVDGSGTSGWVSIGTSNSSKSVSYTFDVNGFTTTEGSIYAGGNISTASGMQANASIKITSKANGYYLTDSSGASYPGVYDNGSNLWIGSSASNSVHHVGKTYISSGYNDSAGNLTIYVAVPNASNNNSALYGVFHAGYLDVGKATTGTLPIARGGTGATTAVGATSNLMAMRSTFTNSYHGLTTPDNSDSDWIRTTAYGLIPYQSGGSSSQLGTGGWPFSRVYSQNYYVGENILLFSGNVLYQGNLAAGGSFETALYRSYKCFVAILSNWAYVMGYRWDVNAGISMSGMTDEGAGSGSWCHKASFSAVGLENGNVKLTLVAASTHKLLSSGTNHEGYTRNVLYVLGVF